MTENRELEMIDFPTYSYVYIGFVGINDSEWYLLKKKYIGFVGNAVFFSFLFSLFKRKI